MIILWKIIEEANMKKLSHNNRDTEVVNLKELLTELASVNFVGYVKEDHHNLVIVIPAIAYEFIEES